VPTPGGRERASKISLVQQLIYLFISDVNCPTISPVKESDWFPIHSSRHYQPATKSTPGTPQWQNRWMSLTKISRPVSYLLGPTSTTIAGSILPLATYKIQEHTQQTKLLFNPVFFEF